MLRKYTDEQIEFIAANIKGRSRKEMVAMFNAHFGLELSIIQMASFLKNHHFKSDTRYTTEQIEWLAANVAGRQHSEVAALFNEHFGTDFPAAKILSLSMRHGLKNGLDYRLPKGSQVGKATQFKKGMTPWNKGMKGIKIGGEATQFKKGQRVWNYKPVGSERINADGYLDVKIADPNKWRGKHKIIWEAANGPVPQGHVLIFADGNPMNVTMDNLLLISRRELAIMNKRGLIGKSAELTKTGIMIADVYLKIGERKRR